MLNLFTISFFQWWFTWFFRNTYQACRSLKHYFYSIHCLIFRSAGIPQIKSHCKTIENGSLVVWVNFSCLKLETLCTQLALLSKLSRKGKTYWKWRINPLVGFPEPGWIYFKSSKWWLLPKKTVEHSQGYKFGLYSCGWSWFTLWNLRSGKSRDFLPIFTGTRFSADLHHF